MYLEQARILGPRWHAETNHTYDGQPYGDSHLKHVNDVGERYLELVAPTKQDIVMSAIWLHDTMEDARKTYNNIVKVFGTEIAEIVRAVTNYGRGRTRDERMPDFVYEDILRTPGAVFVKLCDRIANVEYSLKTGNAHMYQTYQAEHIKFCQKLWRSEYTDMYIYLEKIIKEKPF